MSAPFEEVVRFKRDTFLVTDTPDDPEVVAHPAVPAMQTGVKDTPGGSADGRPGVTLGEPHRLCGKCVQIGCRNRRTAVASKIAVSQIIAEDEDDVGFHRSHDRAGGGAEYEGEQLLIIRKARLLPISIGGWPHRNLGKYLSLALRDLSRMASAASREVI